MKKELKNDVPIKNINDKRNQLRNKIKNRQQLNNINNIDEKIVHSSNEMPSEIPPTWDELLPEKQEELIKINQGDAIRAQQAYKSWRNAQIRKLQSQPQMPQKPAAPVETKPEPEPTTEIENPQKEELPKPTGKLETNNSGDPETDNSGNPETNNSIETEPTPQEIAEKERIKKVKEKKAATEKQLQEVRKKCIDNLNQTLKKEQAAKEKVNQNPNDPKAQKELADAIKEREQAEEAANYYNSHNDNQIIKEQMIKAGDLSKKTISDPPGKVSENAEWIKTNRSKYKNVTKLDASQDRASEKKYINFKQDYVVLIRKKPFYAATAQQRYATADVYNTYYIKDGGTGDGSKLDEFKEKIQTKGEALKDKTGRTILPEDNYLRAYQVNNFINISINTTVHAPGTCSVTIKGAERVICAENNQQAEFGFFSWSDLLGSWLNIDEEATVNDGTGIDYTTGSGWGNEEVAQQNRTNGQASRTDSSNRKAQYTNILRTSGTSWKNATSQWNGVEKGLFDEGQLFRTLFKTREQKYGWRFAEKCDWEP